MQRRRPRRLEVGAVGVVAVGVIVQVLTNVATDSLPEWLSEGWLSSNWVRWPVLTVVVLILLGVDYGQRRRERRAAGHTPGDPPALIKEHNKIHPDGTIEKSKLVIQENETAIEYIRSNDRQDEDD